MNSIVFYIVLSSFLICSECFHTDYVNNVYIVNNADFDIDCQINFKNQFNTFTYPDTTLSEIRIPTWNPSPVKKGEKQAFYEVHTSSWSKFYKRVVPNDTISFIVYDFEVLENLEWSEIRDEYKILKRYDLSIQDMQMLDYEITYPPTEAMKNIKMYPKYEE